MAGFWDTIGYFIFIAVIMAPFWIIPTLTVMKIRKEIKNGKTFKEAWKAVHKNTGGYQHNFPTHSVRSGSSYTGTSITDYTTNPLYSSLPGNIYNRY